jgi:hypothetical protein
LLESSDSPERGAQETEHDALRRLEERLHRASDAAERLMAEATAERPPPAGWQSPRGERGQRPASGDLELLVQVVDSLRELVPGELQQRLSDALREILLATRALIDWYLERLEHRRPGPVEVEDIPIL